MAIFKSRQVNLDPEPYFIQEKGKYYSKEALLADESEVMWNIAILQPRPEFEPTRDPYPWACQALHDKGSCGRRAAQPYQLDRVGRAWAPRREQFDTPVNPILVTFRWAVTISARTAPSLAREWIENPYYQHSLTVSPDQIEHARKVMTRLASLA
jgi:hypothetical protein